MPPVLPLVPNLLFLFVVIAVRDEAVTPSLNARTALARPRRVSEGTVLKMLDIY